MPFSEKSPRQLCWGCFGLSCLCRSAEDWLVSPLAPKPIPAHPDIQINLSTGLHIKLELPLGS